MTNLIGSSIIRANKYKVLSNINLNRFKLNHFYQ